MRNPSSTVLSAVALALVLASSIALAAEECVVTCIGRNCLYQIWVDANGTSHHQKWRTQDPDEDCRRMFRDANDFGTSCNGGVFVDLEEVSSGTTDCNSVFRMWATATGCDDLVYPLHTMKLKCCDSCQFGG